MNKRSLTLFFLLFTFWLVISEEADLQHILAGIVLALFIVWLWHDLFARLPGRMDPKRLLHLVHFILLLIGYIIQANFTVARLVLSSGKPVRPVIVEMHTPVKSNWGMVLLATCITITPGTVTIDVDPDTGRFTVHALTDEIARDLLYWRLMYRIRDLETSNQGRAEHAMDVDRADSSDNNGTH